jgi:hypothetical protein
MVLKSELRAASAEGIDWRKLYAPIYEQSHHRRPLFLDVKRWLTRWNRTNRTVTPLYI